eukprot:Clim_evm10s144 gene=Clim_evmTU10s144
MSTNAGNDPAVIRLCSRYLNDQWWPAREMDQKWLFGVYLQSAEFDQNKDSVTIFYDFSNPLETATSVVKQREAVNIGGRKVGCSNPEAEQSFMNSFDTEHGIDYLCNKYPLPVSVYAQSRMGNSEAEYIMAVGMLHVPAVALDSPGQPHYKIYADPKTLSLKADKIDRLRREYSTIGRSIARAWRIHRDEIGPNRISGRLLIPAYGCASFLSGIRVETSQQTVRRIVAETLIDALLDAASTEGAFEGLRYLALEIMESYLPPADTVELQKRLAASGLYISSEAIDSSDSQSVRRCEWPMIPDGVQAGDFIVNAWDPHSNVGNGNVYDHSLDGFVGRSSTAAFDVHCSARLDMNEAYVTV